MAGFRLPAETRLGRVRLQVASLERSVAYYERILGLRVIAGDGDRAVLGTEADRRPLVELRQRAGVRRVPRGGLLGLYHFAILLPDRASLGRFLPQLETLGESAGVADHAVSEALYLTDPDGLGIEVYADRPRSTWRYDSGELHMTTEPLDVASLIEVGGRQPWTGMPSATTIGHVHLFVADLSAAARFYDAGVGFAPTVKKYPGALFLSAGGYHHHLGTNTWRAESPPASESDARLLEWEVLLPREGDCEAAGRSIEAAGFPVHREDGAWLATDPWGTTVALRA
ncbi:MAG TPA: VOC family protein [Vicinamibacterales bacterium]|nr:VOC family protein [Vicinamibacterales bacterium]